MILRLLPQPPAAAAGDDEKDDLAELGKEIEANKAAAANRDALFDELEADGRPNVRETVASSEFLDWFEKQPSMIQEMGSNPKSKTDSVYVLEAFENATGAKDDPPDTDGGLVKMLGEDFELKDQYGEPTTLKEYIERSGPEVVAILEAGMKAQMGAFSKNSNFVNKQEFQNLQEQLQSTMQTNKELLFWQGVSEVHPDAKKLVASEAGKVWAEKQPDFVKDILVHSLDPNEMSRVVASMKNDLAKENKLASDDDAAASHKAKNGLRGAASRDRKPPRSAGDGDSKSTAETSADQKAEFAEAFDTDD